MNSSNILITEDSLPTFHIVQSFEYKIGYYSRKAQNKKTPSEDSLLIHPLKNGLIIAVADGVGGSPRGYEASSKILKAINEIKPNLKNEEETNHAIIAAIELTNQQLIKINNNPQTTLTLCVITENQLKTFQIGDSGLLVCGQRGKLKFRTSMHSPVGHAVAAGILNEIEAMYHPDANIVDNVIGDPMMKIEIGPAIEINRFDNILLSTDGLTDNIPPEMIIEIIKSGPLPEVMNTLTQACQQKITPDQKTPFHKDDDMTFILCRRMD